MNKLLPVFDYVGHSDRITRGWLEQFKTCAIAEIDRWADKGVTESFVTHKVSVICKDENGHRLGGQKLFKLRTPEAQLGFMTFLHSERPQEP